MVSKKHSNGRLNDDDFVAYIVEWGNVKLAHRICNSIKKDNDVLETPHA